MPANVTNIITWILRILVAAAFLFAAFAKISGQTMMVEEFNRIGFGPEFRYLTGAIEAIGALLVLNPGTTPWGCLLLLCVMVGAFLTQLVILHGDRHDYPAASLHAAGHGSCGGLRFSSASPGARGPGGDH